MARKKYPRYAFYIIHKPSQRIESGWDYREDAMDALDDSPFPRSQLRIVAAKTAQQLVGDVQAATSWVEGEDAGHGIYTIAGQVEGLHVPGLHTPRSTSDADQFDSIEDYEAWRENQAEAEEDADFEEAIERLPVQPARGLHLHPESGGRYTIRDVEGHLYSDALTREDAERALHPVERLPAGRWSIVEASECPGCHAKLPKHIITVVDKKWPGARGPLVHAWKLDDGLEAHAGTRVVTPRGVGYLLGFTITDQGAFPQVYHDDGTWEGFHLRSVRREREEAAEMLAVPGKGASTVQSLLFDRLEWTEASARAWLREHGYRSNKAHVTAGQIRFRQFDPAMHQGEYRTKVFGQGIQAVLAVPR